MTLIKKNRLKKQKDIESLFENSNKSFSFPLKFIWIVKKREDVDYRVTVSVSKRNIRKAVVRNNIKRKIKEAFKHNYNSISEYLEKNNLALDLMFVYVNKTNLDYASINKSMVNFIKKFEDSTR